MIVFFSLILCCYFILLLFLVIGFKRVPSYKETPLQKTIPFSIIIPFRNEAAHLPKLLDSLKSLDYPKELINLYFVDDASLDNSLALIEDFKKVHANVKVLQNNRKTNSPKKDAIATAINEIKTDWIITLDADCVVPVNWITAYAQYIDKHDVSMVIGPVTYSIEKNFLESFQLIDFLSLQLTTIGTYGLGNPILCNGANLAYTKKAFLNVNGFSGNDKIASGDDVFLLDKIYIENARSVGLIKSRRTRVTTFPEYSVKALMQQRIRWAGKSTASKNKLTKVIGIIVLMSNLSFLACVLFFAIHHCFLFLALAVLKIVFDVLYFIVIGSYYKQHIAFFYIFLSSVIYPFFVAFIGANSFFSSYTWKGRVFKQ